MPALLRTALFASLALCATQPARAQDPGGQVCSPWTPGTLDIHHISTGRGSATLLVLPDGTTLLVDAGALSGESPRFVKPRCDASRTPGEWIACYIARVLPAPQLNYFFLTHFHEDHMGQITAAAKPSRSGAYKLSGITEVAEHMKIGKVLDRGWPDYTYPAPLQGPTLDNYRAFLAWQAQHNGMAVERFTPGRNNQIVLLRDPRKFPAFEVRNIMANGEVWTGVGTATRQHFPPLATVARGDAPSENMCSSGLRLSYGSFDYFTGGDVTGIPYEGFPSWQDVESPVAQAVGPVEAAVLNHHGFIDSMNANFVAALRPRIWLLHVWDSAHPTAAVYHRLRSERLYPGPRDIYATNMHDANRVVVSDLDKLASTQGHVLLRVAPGGGTYRVIVIDDSTETQRVLKVAGPYQSR